MSEPTDPLTIAILALSLADRVRLAAILLERGERDLVVWILEGVSVALLWPDDDPEPSDDDDDDDETDEDDDNDEEDAPEEEIVNE